MDEKFILNVIKFIPFFYTIPFILAYVGYCIYFNIEFKKDITIILFYLIVILSVFTLYILKIIKNKFYNFKLTLINNENTKLENIKNILEELPIIVIYKDLDDFILTVNKEALTQFSLSLENIINKPAKEIFPFSFQEQYKNDIEVIKTKKGKFNLLERLMINNKLQIVRTSRVPIFDEYNNVKNIIVFMIDITKKIKLENEEIKKINFYINRVKWLHLVKLLVI